MVTGKMMLDIIVSIFIYGICYPIGFATALIAMLMFILHLIDSKYNTNYSLQVINFSFSLINPKQEKKVCETCLNGSETHYCPDCGKEHKKEVIKISKRKKTKFIMFLELSFYFMLLILFIVSYQIAILLCIICFAIFMWICNFLELRGSEPTYADC